MLIVINYREGTDEGNGKNIEEVKEDFEEKSYRKIALNEWMSLIELSGKLRN